jgi:hypothetical protein
MITYYRNVSPAKLPSCILPCLDYWFDYQSCQYVHTDCALYDIFIFRIESSFELESISIAFNNRNLVKRRNKYYRLQKNRPMVPGQNFSLKLPFFCSTVSTVSTNFASRLAQPWNHKTEKNLEGKKWPFHFKLYYIRFRPRGLIAASELSKGAGERNPFRELLLRSMSTIWIAWSYKNETIIDFSITLLLCN